MRFFKYRFLATLSAMLAMLLGFIPSAHAVPSFARQTGMACAACHTTFPELTEFGRSFKMNGYVLTGMQQIESGPAATATPLKINEIPPLSAMFMTSISQLSKPLADTGTGQNTQNGTFEFPQQLSLFFAGEISDHMGAFSQLTYEPDADHFSIDNTDIRYASHYKVGGADSIWGLTLNNNPTVEDVFQSTPAWGFPFVSSPVTPAPIAATLIDGTLAQDVAGLGGYTFIANHYYAGATLYRSAHLAGAIPFDSTSDRTINGLAPYWRLAYHYDFGHNDMEFGYYGIKADLAPNGTGGTPDKYTDNAIDGYFEHFMGSDSIVFRGTYIHETADLDQTEPGTSDTLKTLKLNAKYNFLGNKSAALGYVHTTGTTDTVLYAPAPNTGSLNGSPDTTSWIMQLNYQPWQNVQLGVQYAWYTKFNGNSDNYDGNGRKASDNNTLFGYAWFVW